MKKKDGLTRVRAIARKLPDVEEGTTFGFPCFKVKGKFFAWFPKKKEVEPGSLGVKVPLLEREHRIMHRPKIFYVTPHYQDYPSVLARVDLMTDAQLKELLTSAHEFVAPKTKRGAASRATRADPGERPRSARGRRRTSAALSGR